MTEDRPKLQDNPLWKKHTEKQKRSIKRWIKSPPSLEEMMEQSRRLARSLELINKGSTPQQASSAENSSFELQPEFLSAVETRYWFDL